ncbi:MAG: propane monooxygenase reductase component [Thermoleophilaceae bacterium]|jgi:propane monooxygenase reductase subunit|nr:propane monooxygenase reductase component [Thermoleophilaceae bacterium]
MPQVVFEPIGEEIECGEEESILDAAFRQGYNLVYGCREGQCSACKCYLLEGEVALKPYSTFALSETEEANGYTLMCRAMPEEDLVVELLHFDPDNYRLENPIREGSATVITSEALTHDIQRLQLKVDAPLDFSFEPGQYVDITVPGGDATRSFSMANLPDGNIELMIKRYPGGRFSGLLDGEIAEGSRLDFTGPYGSFRLRATERPVLLVAGGSGMAPVLSLLRRLAADRSTRPVRFYYGARTQADLFHLDQVEELGARLDDFAFVPVLSESGPEGAELGLVHEAACGCLERGELSDAEVYTCGPPPMIDALIEQLVDGRGFDESRIFYDKFTTSAEAAEGATHDR